MSCAASYWLAEKCVRDPRLAGGVALMLRYLNRWLTAKGHAAMGMDEFEALLKDEGLEIKTVAGTGLAMGLGPKSDGEYYRATEYHKKGSV